MVDASTRFANAAHQAAATDVITGQAVDQASPLPAEILTAIGAMRSHTVSAPIAVPKGYWVVNAGEVTAVAAQSFEAARPSIHDHLADQERPDHENVAARFHQGAEQLTGSADPIRQR